MVLSGAETGGGWGNGLTRFVASPVHEPAHGTTCVSGISGGGMSNGDKIDRLEERIDRLELMATEILEAVRALAAEVRQGPPSTSSPGGRSAPPAD